jgi:ectoine hydroxylase-related dioxygenase (phytanoyl-CoA dioxygenase family)
MSVFQNSNLPFSKISKELENNGYSVLNSALDKKLCDRYLKIVNSNLKKKNKLYGKKTFHGKQTRVLYNLTNKNFKFFELVLDKTINKVCEKYFKNGAYSKDENIYQFDHLHSRILDFPCKSQPLHIDSRISGVYPPTSLHFFIYLSDVNEESGPTQIVPSTHRTNRFPTKKDEIKAKKIIGKKGTVIIINSSTWHGSSEKKNFQRRAILTLVYTRWFLRQQFALPFALPKKFVDKLSIKNKKILGFYNYPPVDENQRVFSRGEIKNYKIKK